MGEIAIELLKNHENSPDGYEIFALIELPDWLAHKLDGLSKRTRLKDFRFGVVGETEKAYQIIYCRDISCTWGWCRPTWFLNYVPKSLVKSIRTDIHQYNEEIKEYILSGKFEKELKDVIDKTNEEKKNG